jgi:phage repressor protein C with HTH and peptisase S24 domain
VSLVTVATQTVAIAAGVVSSGSPDLTAPLALLRGLPAFRLWLNPWLTTTSVNPLFAEIDAAQNGIAVSADLIRDRWGLPESFLRGTLHISGRAAAIVEIYGDSMYDPSEPGAPGSLHPGDRVIVDLGDRRPSPPGAFLVWDGVGVVVKLLDVVRGSEPAKLRLLSRNPRYEPYDATEDEVRIIGRVRGRISVM